MWVDPGGMTGVAVFFGTDGVLWSCDEYPYQVACDILWEACQAYRDRMAVGWERFDITARTHKLTQDGVRDATGVIGVARYASARWGCRVLEPAHQHTPGPADQKKLRALGWWVPGKDDAQSAACHLLRYLERTRNVPPRMAAVLQGDDHGTGHTGAATAQG